MFRARLSLLLGMLCSAAGASSAFAAVTPWPQLSAAQNPYANPSFYYMDGDTLRSALIRIARNFDVQVHFSEDLPQEALNKTVSGHFKVVSPEQLFNQFGSDSGFTWFYYNGILYITPKNFVTKNFYVAPGLIANLKNALINDGLLNAQFSWSELPSEGLVVVSGPNEYLDLISKKIKKLNIAPVDQQFAVFRLKYASAVDTTVDLASGQITIPGVATILKSILQGNQNTQTGVDNKLLQQVTEPLKNNLKSMLPNLATSPVPFDETPMPGGASGEKTRPSGSLTSPVVESDNRLNTIIVRDKSSNIPIYKALIRMLDVPTPLIQVSVMIVDVDRKKLNSAGVNWWGNTGSLNFLGSSSGGGGSNSVAGGFGANNLATAPAAGAPALGLSYGSVSPGNLVVNNLKSFIAGLQFMETNGYAKAEAKTAVVTIDNIAAVVNLTESFYAVNAQTSQATPLQAQMQMQVTPHVIFDADGKRRVKLVVSLKDGHVEERIYNGMPLTSQGNLSSQAVIDEGNSLLLAGFTRKQSEQVESKVPLLGDIPILGFLFKSKTDDSRDYQRSYLVTPQIIWADAGESTAGFDAMLNDAQSSSDGPQKK